MCAGGSSTTTKKSRWGERQPRSISIKSLTRVTSSATDLPRNAHFQAHTNHFLAETPHILDSWAVIVVRFFMQDTTNIVMRRPLNWSISTDSASGRGVATSPAHSLFPSLRSGWAKKKPCHYVVCRTARLARLTQKILGLLAIGPCHVVAGRPYDQVREQIPLCKWQFTWIRFPSQIMPTAKPSTD